MALSLLVLTDFFQPADHALTYADALAGAISAELVLLHVRRDSVLDSEYLTGRVDALSQEAIDLALASLTRKLSAPVVAEVAHGQVANAVADILRRHQPALVVLGHRNTDAMPDELVSTAALDILRTAPQPMLVVPGRAAATVPQRVLWALDAKMFSLGAHAVLVRHLLDALHAKLTVLYVGSDEVSTAAGTDTARRPAASTWATTASSCSTVRAEMTTSAPASASATAAAAPIPRPAPVMMATWSSRRKRSRIMWSSPFGGHVECDQM